MLIVIFKWLSSGISGPFRYSAARGVAWLEHGGVWIDANIRGGGEYGPRWHQAVPWRSDADDEGRG